MSDFWEYSFDCHCGGRHHRYGVATEDVPTDIVVLNAEPWRFGPAVAEDRDSWAFDCERHRADEVRRWRYGR